MRETPSRGQARRRRLVLISIAILAFLVISALLARAFSAEGAESSALSGLIQAQARGDRGAMVARIQGCRASSACQARVALDAAALRRTGPISILQIQLSTGFSLGGTLGTARVAWRAGSSLPVVQCVRVRRAGSVLSGIHVELLELSQRIKSDQDCPPRF
ncbi:MAG: hypothetical protein ACR2IP_06260 [Solirubrobacteraceae bacterium]